MGTCHQQAIRVFSAHNGCSWLSRVVGRIAAGRPGNSCGQRRGLLLPSNLKAEACSKQSICVLRAAHVSYAFSVRVAWSSSVTHALAVLLFWAARGQSRSPESQTPKSPKSWKPELQTHQTPTVTKSKKTNRAKARDPKLRGALCARGAHGGGVWVGGYAVSHLA